MNSLSGNPFLKLTGLFLQSFLFFLFRGLPVLPFLDPFRGRLLGKVAGKEKIPCVTIGCFDHFSGSADLVDILLQYDFHWVPFLLRRVRRSSHMSAIPAMTAAVERIGTRTTTIITRVRKKRPRPRKAPAPFSRKYHRSDNPWKRKRKFTSILTLVPILRAIFNPPEEEPRRERRMDARRAPNTLFGNRHLEKGGRGGRSRPPTRFSTNPLTV